MGKGLYMSGPFVYVCICVVQVNDNVTRLFVCAIVTASSLLTTMTMTTTTINTAAPVSAVTLPPLHLHHHFSVNACHHYTHANAHSHTSKSHKQLQTTWAQTTITLFGPTVSFLSYIFMLLTLFPGF
jgi:hypothetical protein